MGLSCAATLGRLGLLVGAAVMLWLVVLGCACWLNVNDPGPIPRKVVHPLSAFDGVFRKVGPLLPFCVALPRAFVPLPASRCAHPPPCLAAHHRAA